MCSGQYVWWLLRLEPFHTWMLLHFEFHMWVWSYVLRKHYYTPVRHYWTYYCKWGHQTATSMHSITTSLSLSFFIKIIYISFYRQTHFEKKNKKSRIWICLTLYTMLQIFGQWCSNMFALLLLYHTWKYTTAAGLMQDLAIHSKWNTFISL